MACDTVLEQRVVSCGVKTPMSKIASISEREVIELVKKGDKEIYQKIVLRYMKTAYYIALGFVHNQQDALDVSQEAFIKAFRKIKSFDSQKPFFPWFYRLLRNLCIDHIRLKIRQNEVPLEESKALKEEKDDWEMKQVLWKGIHELPFEQREVIILRYFRQFSYQEIAELTGNPVGTIMSSLHYAKKRLKVIIGKYLSFE